MVNATLQCSDSGRSRLGRLTIEHETLIDVKQYITPLRTTSQATTVDTPLQAS